MAVSGRFNCISIFLLVSVAEKSSLSLIWLETSKDRFSQVAAHMMDLIIENLSLVIGIR